MPTFFIIIPVYQEYNIFRIFWDSLTRTVKYPVKICIINDASPHNTTDFIRNLQSSDLMYIEKIEHHRSEGSIKCINEALLKASGDYIVLMDSDLILSDGWQESVIQTMANESIGGMGCVLIYPQTGGIQSCGLTYTETAGRHLFLNNVSATLDKKLIYEVQATVFAFFVTRVNIVQSVGLLDTCFFNGYEDVDYQLRIRSELNKKIVINSNLRMFHWEQSNGILRNYNRRSNIAYLWKKHGSHLKVDLWQFLFEQLQKHIRPNNYYIGVDLCSARFDADTFWQELQISQIAQIKRIDHYYHTVREDKNIWLSQVLPYDYFRTEQPFLFLCDNFIKLLDNQYWLNFREKYCQQDIIADLYGNVVEWKDIKHQFWPGNKIR